MKLEKQNKANLIEFNFLRAFGIFLVVLGHSFPYIDEVNITTYKYIHSLIYSFHMPLFIFISGFFATKMKTIKNLNQYSGFIKSKFQRLIIPYLVISTFTIPIKLILNKFSERPVVLSQIISDILFFPWNNPIIFFWFIYVLFLIFVFSPLVIKLNKYVVLTLFFIISILHLGNIEFMGITTILKYSIFFFCGFYFNSFYMKNREKLLNYKLNIWMTITVILIPIVMFFSNLNIFTQNQDFISTSIINAFYVLKAFLGIYISFVFCIFIYKFRHIKVLSSVFNSLSTYSFDIYLLSWFPQIFARIVFYQILNLDYNVVVIISLILGFTPIIVSKFILRKFKITRKIILGLI